MKTMNGKTLWSHRHTTSLILLGIQIMTTLHLTDIVCVVYIKLTQESVQYEPEFRS